MMKLYNFISIYFITITEKCTLLRDLCKLSQQGSLTLTELIFISCKYLIPNDWKQISL